jgi:hypothetical protein
VTGEVHRREFDDVILGRHGDAWFEVFECKLTRKEGKSTTIVFKGVVLAFKIETPFEGKLIATRRIGGFDRWMRDLFGKDSLLEVASGDAGLDRDYEFRTDNPDGAAALFRSNLGRALSWVRETWPGEPARIALSGDDAFLLLPTARNFFELPDISVTLDYEAHIGPLAAQMASLIATAALVRQACVPVAKGQATDQPPPTR